LRGEQVDGTKATVDTAAVVSVQIGHKTWVHAGRGME
jgi:hypothetical protein